MSDSYQIWEDKMQNLRNAELARQNEYLKKRESLKQFPEKITELDKIENQIRATFKKYIELI